MPDDAHGCGPECEPWITATHCGLTKYEHVTGELLAVSCPSKTCCDLMVPLVASRIAPHVPTVGAARGRCPWTGIRVVDDRPPFQTEIVQLRPTDSRLLDDQRVMNYDFQAEAEIDVLTDVLTTLGNAADTHVGCKLSDADRVRLFAVVLYELIVGARSVGGPDAGRLYAAPILDPIIEGVAVADEVSPLDLLIPALLDRQTRPGGGELQ